LPVLSALAIRTVLLLRGYNLALIRTGRVGIAFRPLNGFDPTSTEGRIMRPCQVLLLALLLPPLAGCFTPRPGAAPQTALPDGPNGSVQDAVYLLVAVVERPVADGYLNDGLWEWVNEQLLEPELKGLLLDNGFRVGVLGGNPPAAFQNLISERSCPNPRRIALRPNTPTSVTLGPVWSECVFRVYREGEPMVIDLAQAQCQLQVTPAAAGDSQVALHFTPCLRHGPQAVTPCAVLDPDGSRRWDLRAEQAVQAFDWLSWDLRVDPSQFVVIGTDLNQTDSLGRRCFLFTETETPVQRLLVLRTMHSATDPLLTDKQTLRSPPLALQAGSFGSIRATAP
jgi:hypothetical protein